MKVTFVVVELATTAPFAIGARRQHREIDLELVRDGDGRPLVPGSSLAGSLRQHLAAAGAAERLMGSAPPSGGRADDDEPTTPSPLWVLGAVVADPASDGDDVTVVQRHRTAIDPGRGAAATSMLRSTELVAAGTVVTAYLRIDRDLADDEIDLLASWRPVLGRGRTSGLGTCEVTALRIGTLDLGTPEGLRTWLVGGGPDLCEQVARTVIDLTATSGEPIIEQRVRIVDGLAVGTGRPSNDNDRPVLRDPDGTPVVEGSSIKGVLRGRVAFILRSLGVELCDDRSCGRCPECEVFGSTEQRGRIAVDRARIDGSTTTKQKHVGLDRFTGGAADRLLFDTEVVTAGTFVLRVRAIDDLPPWAPDLLRWAVRDLLDGLVGLGGLTARGHGTVAVDGDDTVGTPPPLDPASFATAWASPGAQEEVG